MNRYELLHYRGYVEEGVSAGRIIGSDELGRPYAVIDAEYQPECDTTTVFLQYATPEQITAEINDVAARRDHPVFHPTFAAFRPAGAS